MELKFLSAKPSRNLVRDVQMRVRSASPSPSSSSVACDHLVRVGMKPDGPGIVVVEGGGGRGGGRGGGGGIKVCARDVEVRENHELSDCNFYHGLRNSSRRVERQIERLRRCTQISKVEPSRSAAAAAAAEILSGNGICADKSILPRSARVVTSESSGHKSKPSSDKFVPKRSLIESQSRSEDKEKVKVVRKSIKVKQQQQKLSKQNSSNQPIIRQESSASASTGNRLQCRGARRCYLQVGLGSSFEVKRCTHTALSEGLQEFRSEPSLAFDDDDSAEASKLTRIEAPLTRERKRVNYPDKLLSGRIKRHTDDKSNSLHKQRCVHCTRTPKLARHSLLYSSTAGACSKREMVELGTNGAPASAHTEARPKSIATHYQEGLFFGQPNWQTDLTESAHLSQWETSADDNDNDDDEYGQHTDKKTKKKQDKKGASAGNQTKKKRKGRRTTTTAGADEDEDDLKVSLERAILESLGGFGVGVAGFELSAKGKQVDEGQDDDNAKVKRTLKGNKHSKPPRLLARQSKALSTSSLELVSPPLGMAKFEPQASRQVYKLDDGDNGDKLRVEIVKPSHLEGEQKSEKRKRARGPRLGYWPLNNSGFSFSFGATSDRATTSSSGFSSSENCDTHSSASHARFSPFKVWGGNKRKQEHENAVESHEGTPNHHHHHHHHSDKMKCSFVENILSGGSKFLAGKNLLGALIAAYILLSLIVIIILAPSYWSSHKRTPEQVKMVRDSGTSIHDDDDGGGLMISDRGEPVTRLKESRATQTDDRHQGTQRVDRQQQQHQHAQAHRQSLQDSSKGAAANAHTAGNGASAPSLSGTDHHVQQPQQQRQQQSELAIKLERKKQIIARLNQIRTETRARESQDFQELWRILHKRQCQPLKLSFCSRSVQSMIPTTTAYSGGALMSQTISSANSGAGDGGGSSSSSSSTFDISRTSYDQTLLPNQFTVARHKQVERALEKYEPLVEVRCYALMPLFLCSIFAPKCIQVNATAAEASAGESVATTGAATKRSSLQGAQEQQVPEVTTAADFLDRLFPVSKSQAKNRDSNKVRWSRLVPPCRSVCKEALRRCTFFLEVLSLQLFDPDDCDNLPESSDENVCVGQRENLLLQKSAENRNCRNDDFRCGIGECIPKEWRCDGFADCKDKSDEEECSRCDAQTEYYCGNDVCISKRQVCDGRPDCKDKRDERLCLRLAPSNLTSSSSLLLSNASKSGPAATATSNFEILRQQPRRLEAWNSSISSWVSVCGLHWQAMPMSHEACQELGFTRASETVISLGPASTTLLKAASSSSSSDKFSSATKQSSRIRRMPPAIDHQVTYERLKSKAVVSPRPAPVNPLAGSPIVSVKSLAELMQAGAQSGCELEPADQMSSVHLTCHDFKCGNSVTSHLTRINMPLAAIATETLGAGGPLAAAPEVSPTKAQVNWTSAGGGGGGSRSVVVSSSLTSTGESGEVSEQRIDQSKVDDKPELLNEVDSDNDKDNDKDDDDDKDDGNREKDSEPFLSNLIRPEDNKSATGSTGGRYDDANEDNLLAPVSSRLVVGGLESMPGEFPYVAALHGGPDEVFFCGGVVISANWLLTAAHCVGNRTRPDGWMVKVGVTRRIASPAFVKKLKVRKIIKHHLFNQGAHLNNDIALIQLDTFVEFNQYLRPICLPQANLRLGPDNSKDCVVVGFGKSRFSPDANYLHVAHFARVPIIHQAVCSEWYAKQDVTLSDGMLCAGYSDGKRDACQGDSGSGLFCRYADSNQFFVAGVVSFGIKCATPELPGVYTSVPSYVDWISKVTRENAYPVI